MTKHITPMQLVDAPSFTPAGSTVAGNHDIDGKVQHRIAVGSVAFRSL